MTTQSSVAQRLARYVCTLQHDDIPPDAVAQLKRVMTHDLLMAVVGSEAPETQRALEFIRSDAGSAGPSTVIAQRFKASPLDAAFANAVMIRALRQEATMLPSGIHGTAIMLPVALALAEQLRNTGRDVVTALIAGHEVCGKLDRAGPEKRMIRTASHTYGAFGAAAVAAKLLQLDEQQTTIALAYAGNLAVTITAGFEDHQYGLLARNGLTAAYLGRARAPARADAIEGVPGFYDSQLAGPPSRLEEALGELGIDYEVMDTVVKPFPCGLGATVAAAVLRRIVDEHRLQPDQIIRVVIHRPAESNDAYKHARGPFPDKSQAISSVPLALAAVLADGEVTLERLDNYNDPDVLRLARLVEFVDIAPGGPLYQRVQVDTRTGQSYVGEGDWKLLSAPDPRGIARAYRRAILDETRAVELAELIGRIDRVESIGELTHALAGDA
jgi:2-methylcitrate dehydratase PrpD